ncbi:Protein T05H10.8 [Aphelenchoides avenae]|nr:Protein T05H10.8 [Aphelenchus avenae]
MAADAEDARKQKIKEIVVIPSPEAIRRTTEDLNQTLRETGEFIRTKTRECEQAVGNASAISFTANSLQSRITGTEFCNQLTKLYEALEVRTMADYEKKVEDMRTSEHANEETAALLQELDAAFQEWEGFLQKVDKEVDQVAGPNKSTLSSEDNIQLLSKNKMMQNSTLLSYVKNSAFDMLLIEVVMSFTTPECAEHITKIYEQLGQFQAIGCDILLTKGAASEGGGFLKLIGVPFRMLLDEEQSMARILQHRQSAVSMAGRQALHMFTEIVCNDDALRVDVDGESGDDSKAPQQIFGKLGGCILVDRKGRVLYNYVCADSTDWPDVDILMEQVRIHKKATAEEKQLEDDVSNGSKKAAATDETDTRVAVTKKKCCVLL